MCEQIFVTSLLLGLEQVSFGHRLQPNLIHVAARVPQVQIGFYLRRIRVEFGTEFQRVGSRTSSVFSESK